MARTVHYVVLLSFLCLSTLTHAQWSNSAPNPNQYGAGSSQFGSNSYGSQYGQSTDRYSQNQYGGRGGVGGQYGGAGGQIGGGQFGGTGNTLEPFRVVYEWTNVEYSWIDEMSKQQALSNRRYIPENNAIAGIKTWRDRLIVTIPRWKDGIPVTLASLPANGLPNAPPRLDPFPDWQMQEIGNCTALQFVQSVEIDTEGRIWILDVGRTNTLNGGVGAPTSRCPPKLVIIDMNSVQFPQGQFGGGFPNLPYNPNQPNQYGQSGYNSQYPQPGQPGYNPSNPSQYPQPGQPGYNVNNQYPQPGQPGYNPNNQYPQPGQPGYNANNQYPQPGQPGYNANNQYPQPGQPGYNPNNQYPQPGQPGYNPNNQYPQPGQPGYNPNNQYPQPGQPGYNANNQYPQPGQPGYNANNQYPQPGQPGYNPNNQYGRNSQYPNSYNTTNRYDQFGNALPSYNQPGYNSNNQYLSNQGFGFGYGGGYRIIKSFNFPTNVATPFGNYMNDLVLDNTNGWYAYITDHGDDPGIIVYSFREDRAWKVKDARSMRSDPDVGFVSINNIDVELRGKNIDGIALSPSSGYERTLYFSPLGSYNLYSLQTSSLKNANLNSDVSSAVVDLGRKQSITDGMIMDNRGNLYFGLLGLNAIGVWNSKQGRFTDSQRVLSRDSRSLQWADSFAIDDNGNLYVVTNRLQNYITGRVSPNEPNYRILRAQIGARSYLQPADLSAPNSQFGGAGANGYGYENNYYYWNSATISSATSVLVLITSAIAFFLAR